MSILTARSYYKHFASIYGAITAAIGGLPIVSMLVPPDFSSYLFPPLGPIRTFCVIATLIFSILITVIVYSTKDSAFVLSKSSRPKVQLKISIVAVIGLFIYLGVHFGCVRVLQPKVRGDTKPIIVSVGWQRSDYALLNYAGESDEDMLESRGPREEEINRLWTRTSVIVARLILFGSYLFFFLPAVAVSSLGILFDKLEKPVNP